jgi:hypothetical protein
MADTCYVALYKKSFGALKSIPEDDNRKARR